MVRHILSSLRIDPDRLALEWASAAEAIRFVDLIRDFTERIVRMGPLKVDEALLVRMRASRAALEDVRIRMALARQVRESREDGNHGSTFRIGNDLEKTLSEGRLAHEILLHLGEDPMSLYELARRVDCPPDTVWEAFSKLLKRKLVAPDRLTR